ncbi:MAG: nicotinate-nucleotide diphosphorylase (carboxylating) [Bacteroidetes bacterium GWE2_29_8]|nr:MAG: nicotinate-nucleotide diphosphorylase (carboxylating) [Bacteroidetes bacterium GWE2_29_8]OFY21754.1 MAG: nicotinate-nucleotide diphosphorylase (carboxylating) [Bacteroidetes bacterium GWF2_29_10]
MELEQFIINAIEEDVRDGDHTSLACIDSSKIGYAKLIVKDKGIIAGVEIAKQIFNIIDNSVELKINKKDGDKVNIGDISFYAFGSVHSLLKAERLVLNFMQRMSGIATTTNKYVTMLAGLNTKILDTRKTTPNFRYFEKLAVKIGGGQNHRMGLFDMILIKDNHIDFAGGIKNAIENTKNYLQKNKLNLKIEIEARSIDDIEEIINIGGVDIIMIDNFNPTQMKKAVDLINGSYFTEGSGGINLNNLREYAETGVDFISIGSLTHKINSLDLSLKAVIK